MNKFKVIFFFSLLAVFYGLSGQTPVIASKAYYTNEFDDFSLDETFGLPNKSIDSFVRISKDSMVEFGTFFTITRDTMRIKDHNIFNDGKYNIDSIKAKYANIKFINFEKFEKTTSKKSKKKRKGDLPFLFLNLKSIFLKLMPFVILFIFMLVYNYRTIILKFIYK